MSKQPLPAKPFQTRVKHAFYAVMSFAFSQRRGYLGGSPEILHNHLANAENHVWEKAVRALRKSASLERDCLGVVVHAFYPDVFVDIIEHLNGLPPRLHLYVTTSPESEAAISACLASSRHPHTLVICENRGKDILPFLKVAPLLIENRHACFLKIHTKKSPHRRYGFFWRNDIYSKLMSPKALAAALDAFEREPGIGIIAPKDHLVPMTHYSKSIQDRLVQLAEQIGVSKEVTLGLRFAAGTMFFARTECVLPLLGLSLDDEDFESEHGQIDGTLAHAMERLFAVAAQAVSLSVVDTDFARRVAETRPKTPRRDRNTMAAGARGSLPN